MSHFVMGVIVPNNVIKDSHIYDIARNQVADYDENLEVDEYDAECTCKSYNSLKILQELEKGMTFEDLIEKVDKDFTDPERVKSLLIPLPQLSKEFLERINAAKEAYWHGTETRTAKEIEKSINEISRDYKESEEELKKYISDALDYDKECDSCRGTGFYKSTYNPNSKLDSFDTGGRWHSLFNDIDMDNFPVPVSLILDKLEKNNKPVLFGYVTPEKEWIEKGEMGWWGVVNHEKENWIEEEKSILEKYNDGNFSVIIIDCHI